MRICTTLGFKNAPTYIQSGNVVFESGLAEKSVRARLEEALTRTLGRILEREIGFAMVFAGGRSSPTTRSVSAISSFPPAL